jgi:hypothetical protein
MNPRYSTREAVKTALDFMETARANSAIDGAIVSATESVESQLHRKFYPWSGTRYFDWPIGRPVSVPWRLWLYQHEAISLSLLVAGGITIPASNYLLEPVNDGPPYDRIEINLSTSSAFSAGPTYQRAIAGTGVFGYTASTEPAGALAEALDLTETGVDVTDSGIVGVGDSLLIDAERMLVTGKAMLDTGQTITSDLAASAAAVTVGIQAGTAVAVGETILVDSERMLVVDQAGNNLTCKRAFDGSVLATHSTGAHVYAPRTLTVVRATQGTAAATHNNATAITKGVIPGPAQELATAEALNALLQKQSGYARTVGTGDNIREFFGRGLTDIRAQAYASHGRKARGRAV